MADEHPDAATLGYQSAMDMPSFVELRKQMDGFAMLKWLLPKKERAEFEKLKKELPELAVLVDAFYDKLGARGWIFHDMLPTSRVRDDVVAAGGDEEAEAALCGIYLDTDQLRFMIGQTMQLEEIRARRDLLDRAAEDFAAGRYYAVVLVLLTAMDGFVNDVENIHRGLHAREASELQSWDTAVGHHKGLTATQRSFTKSYSRRVDEESHDLSRNGILHGNITKYDNVIVAAKAWNRLFAVVDWARSQERRDTPKPSEPTWAETMAKLKDNATMNRALEAWKPSNGTADTTDEYGNHPSMMAAARFLELWRSRNWGHLAQMFSPIGKPPAGNATPVEVKSAFAMFPIAGFAIHGYTVEAAAISVVTCTLALDDSSVEASLRMTFVDENGDARVEGFHDGEWKMVFRAPEMYAPGIIGYSKLG
jgi:hypothetical protein